MGYRRCFKCGSSSDDQYGFCIKCGAEFKNIENKSQDNVCINCGFENIKNATRCVKCGTPLLFGSENDIFIKNPEKKDTGKIIEFKPLTTKQKLLVLLGYIFSILGGIIGLVISIYLITRTNYTLRKHGSIQLTILVFYLIMFFVILMVEFNGDISALMNNYTSIIESYSL